MKELNRTDTLSRGWVLTLCLHNAHTCLEESDQHRLCFIAYGDEIRPEIGALHYQAYM